jgi:hypothetical protein
MAKAKVRQQQHHAAPSSLMSALVGSAHLRKDGHPLPLVRTTGGADTETEVFGIDMSSAPIPQRRYAAEQCSVRFANNEVRIIFGQLDFSGDSFETALLIRMSPKALKQFADSLHGMSDPSPLQVCTILKVEPETLCSIKSAKQIVNMAANICSVAVSGHESCMDFYHTSAFASLKSRTTHQLEVEPVVRVDLRTSLLVPLIAGIFDVEKTELDVDTGEI